MSEEKIQITAYLKTYCGWSEGVRAIMRKYKVAVYPIRDKDWIDVGQMGKCTNFVNKKI
mgnify:CR=1 FL=1